MSVARRFAVRALLGACLAGALLAPAAPAGAQGPRVVSLRPDELARARERVAAGDSRLRPAYERLLRDAGAALSAGPFSVTHKARLLAPSGDRHDYHSLSPYWWPDPAKPGGLPWIRRDGQTNPESKRDLDQPRVSALGSSVETLALAYWLSGEERYAARAALLLRTWFLDPATRMNPHLRYAQAVPGVAEGRGSGIIDSRSFIHVVDAVGMIAGSRSWTEADQRGMEGWMREYLRWLQTSPNGEHELGARNNHGSWFDAQRAVLALFVGERELAKEIVEGVRMRRIDTQIRPDGSMPHELGRTRSLWYTGFNLEALSRLAEVGRQVKVDLWGYESPTGGSLRRTVELLGPYADPAAAQRWPDPQITTDPPDQMLLNLRRARVAYEEPRYTGFLAPLPAEVAGTDRSVLLYPSSTNRPR